MSKESEMTRQQRRAQARTKQKLGQQHTHARTVQKLGPLDAPGAALFAGARSSMESQQGAVHEATHAVTALQFGFEVPKVTIIEDSDYAGHTIVNTPAYNGQGKKKYLPVIYADALVSLVGVIFGLATPVKMDQSRGR